MIKVEKQWKITSKCHCWSKHANQEYVEPFVYKIWMECLSINKIFGWESCMEECTWTKSIYAAQFA